MDETAFALADPDPHGKCTFEIKVSLPEQIGDELAMLAAIDGITKSQYVRDVLIEHLHGRVSVARMRARRRAPQS